MNALFEISGLNIYIQIVVTIISILVHLFSRSVYIFSVHVVGCPLYCFDCMIASIILKSTWVSISRATAIGIIYDNKICRNRLFPDHSAVKKFHYLFSIGDDMVISYKVDTNFIKKMVKSISCNYVNIE
jgi:hypothetical protein